MQQLERDLDLISVILDDARTLAARIQRFSLDGGKFVNDRSDDGELAYDAVMSPVYRIAEDAIHLSEDVVRAFPDYPWRQIRGFRNFVAHGYREVDRSIAWHVASEDIPVLADCLQEYWDDNAPLLLQEEGEGE
ncbi:HepT-like ribonuclease domain-containing protein [Adlercreutzia sp. R21]|uniref:HepT-like ribonuclease domain-containing protein n=1 Tax=Adlercreutzia wanghongyangiae TaxID=3111451 RepID=UPI002DB608C3|nr:HepT-like ribonuclease domain-containing protein [Adlercreutzia sp. R21]MEC4183953.1 HepT-like ribonuclease domain-containing protein [Adlercreutzia sp. R21]